MAATLSVRLANRLDEFQRFDTALDEFARVQNLPDTVVFPTRLAIDELFVNIVSYGYTDKKTHEIEVELTVDEEKITIDIRDDGIAFDPLSEVAAPNLDVSLEDREIGGNGIHIVKSLMNDVTYKRENNRNHLCLIKNLID